MRSHFQCLFSVLPCWISSLQFDILFGCVIMYLAFLLEEHCRPRIFILLSSAFLYTPVCISPNRFWKVETLPTRLKGKGIGCMEWTLEKNHAFGKYSLSVLKCFLRRNKGYSYFNFRRVSFSAKELLLRAWPFAWWFGSKAGAYSESQEITVVCRVKSLLKAAWPPTKGVATYYTREADSC